MATYWEEKNATKHELSKDEVIKFTVEASNLVGAFRVNSPHLTNVSWVTDRGLVTRADKGGNDSTHEARGHVGGERQAKNARHLLVIQMGERKMANENPRHQILPSRPHCRSEDGK